MLLPHLYYTTVCQGNCSQAYTEFLGIRLHCDLANGAAIYRVLFCDIALVSYDL
jgi:hypothetical protein